MGEVDIELEKLVFLFNAEEGNPGLYELIYELGVHAISIEDKYRIAHEILIELLQKNLIVLQEFKDNSLKEKIGSIALNEATILLNNPTSWYPSYKPTYTIEITDLGSKHLDEAYKTRKDDMEFRLFKIHSKK